MNFDHLQRKTVAQSSTVFIAAWYARVRYVVAAAVLATATPAFAYIDPNMGGWLYQLLFPVLVAVGAAWAGLRHYIKDWWSRLFGRRDDASTTHDKAEPRD